jgi:alpha-beta hydrolase superfamily lysophospholipase
MKRWLIGLVVAVSLAIAFVAGPRVDLAYRLHPVELPADLDGYLREREARVPNLVPSAAKTIVWADAAAKTPTKFSIVYLHGFSATRQEIAPVCERLAAALNANVFFTRLAGHGRDGPAMAEASVERWLQDGVEALAIGRRLGDKVVMVATSTGATLATWLLANGYGEDVAALVMISPNFGPRDRSSELLLLPWGGQIARLVVGPTYRWQPINELHRRHWTIAFPVAALLPMMGLVELGRESDLEGIRVPMLTFYSPDDRIVDSGAIEAVFARFGSQRKELVALERTGDPQRHVLAGDILSPGTTDEAVARMRDFLAPLR